MPFRFYCEGDHKCRIFFIVFVVFAVQTSWAQAQTQQDLLREVYFQSSAYPETFDTFVENTPPLFASPFRMCINEAILVRLEPMSNRHIEMCPDYPPERHGECITANEPLKMQLWLKDISRVIYQNTPWINTDSGRTAIIADFDPDLIRAFMPQANYMLMCSQ